MSSSILSNEANQIISEEQTIAVVIGSDAVKDTSVTWNVTVGSQLPQHKPNIPAKTKDIIYYINKIAALHRTQEQEHEEVKRYALFPIIDEEGYKFYKKQEITHWSEDELDFTADCVWYKSCSDNLREVVDTILAFFLVGDGAISNNIIYRFLLECKTYEEECMFISQLHIELIHAATYGLAAFTFKKDPESMANLVESAQKTPCVIAKIDFMEKWMFSSRPRYQRLVAFACAEGIFFCALFGVIYWIQSKGWFPNFVLANELIGADESLHRDFGCFLFGKELNEILSKFEPGSEAYKAVYAQIESDVKEIVGEAMAIEEMFVRHLLREPLEDLNANDLVTYTKLIVDNLYSQLSFSPMYNVSNPFTWMDNISMQPKSNFYEVRVGAYKKKALADVLNWRKRAGLIQDKTNLYENPEDVDF